MIIKFTIRNYASGKVFFVEATLNPQPLNIKSDSILDIALRLEQDVALKLHWSANFPLNKHTCFKYYKWFQFAQNPGLVTLFDLHNIFEKLIQIFFLSMIFY